MINTWNEYCFRINMFYSALYSRMDSSHGGSIVECLTFAHHFVQIIFLKLIENGLNNFICIFFVQWKKFRNNFFICTSLLSIFTYQTIWAILLKDVLSSIDYNEKKYFAAFFSYKMICFAFFPKSSINSFWFIDERYIVMPLLESCMPEKCSLMTALYFETNFKVSKKFSWFLELESSRMAM